MTGLAVRLYAWGDVATVGALCAVFGAAVACVAWLIVWRVLVRRSVSKMLVSAYGDGLLGHGAVGRPDDSGRSVVV